MECTKKLYQLLNIYVFYSTYLYFYIKSRYLLEKIMKNKVRHLLPNWNLNYKGEKEKKKKFLLSYSLTNFI